MMHAHGARERERNAGLIEIYRMGERVAARRCVERFDQMAPADIGDGEILAYAIGAGDAQEITWRPQVAPVLISHVHLADAREWLVHDVQICGRTVLKQPGAIPAEVLGEHVVDSFAAFRPCQVAMDLRFVVQYVGSAGAAFFDPQFFGWSGALRVLGIARP